MNGPRLPLEGIVVVSLEQALAVPLATRKMADAGARVIKIERPGGDVARSYDRVVNGGSAYFVWLNRGKESIVVDLKDRDDAALLRRMLSRADVFVQNLAPGAAARAGFDSRELRQAFPRLITADLTGYGEGPYAHMKAYDNLVQGEAGLQAVTGTPEEAVRVGISICDIAGGMHVYTGVLEALALRERTGLGSALDISLFGAISDWMTVPWLHEVYGGHAPQRSGLRHPSIAPYGPFVSGDGDTILLAAHNEREWRSLCVDVLRRPDLEADPRFVDNPSRVAHRGVLDPALQAEFSGIGTDDLVDRLERAGIAFGRVRSVASFAEHPHLRLMEVSTPEGPVRLPDDPVVWRDRPSRPADAGGAERDVVPCLDAHGSALRREFAAVSAAPVGLTRALARAIVTRPIAPADFSHAERYVRDWLGSFVAGASTPIGAILRRYGAVDDGLDGRVFVAAATSHVTETDDLHNASVTHPACVVVPVAWLLGRERGAGGHAVLRAILAGYEAMIRVGEALGPAHYRIFHNTATAGVFGSAAAAASLLELDEERWVWALGNAGTQAAGLWQFNEEGAMSKPLHAGHAAAAGLRAARLAEAGLTGAEAILEGPKGLFRALCPDARPERLLAEAPGWKLPETSMKPYPCCRHVHPAIDAALEVRARSGLEPRPGEGHGANVAGIRSIRISSYPAALDVTDRADPATPHDARFSIQYAVATTLLRGRPGLESFESAAVTDPSVRRLISRTSVSVAPAFAAAYPQQWGAAIEVEWDDGRTARADRASATGDPDQPLDDRALDAKVLGLFAWAGMAEATGRSLLDAVSALAEDAAPVPLPGQEGS